MGGCTIQQHRVQTGCFAAKLSSSEWLETSSGKVRFNVLKKPKGCFSPPRRGPLGVFLFFMKLIIISIPLLSVICSNNGGLSCAQIPETCGFDQHFDWYVGKDLQYYNDNFLFRLGESCSISDSACLCINDLPCMIKASNLHKQNFEKVFSLGQDNGYPVLHNSLGKEYVKNLSIVWSCAAGGGNSGLMDIAEVQTGEGVVMAMAEESDMEIVLLRKCLEERLIMR